MRTRSIKSLAVASVLLSLASCSTWYTSIENNPDGSYALTRNHMAGILFGGPEASVWIGHYDPATNQLRIRKVVGKGF